MRTVIFLLAIASLFASGAAERDVTVWRLPLDASKWSGDGRSDGSVSVLEEGGTRFLRLSCTRNTNDWGFAAHAVLPERWTAPAGRLMARCRVHQCRRVMMGTFWSMWYSPRRAFGKPVYVASAPMQRLIDELHLDTFPVGAWIDCEEDVRCLTNIVDRFTVTLNVQGGKPGEQTSVDIAGFELFVRDDPETVAKRAEWESFRRNFRADYSDGSKHLLPKEGNRFKTPFRVAEGGRPACQIVVASTPWWYEKLSNETTAKAASELQRLLRLITGAEVPVVGLHGLKEEIPSIFVGKGCFRFAGTWRAKSMWQRHATSSDDPAFFEMERDLAALDGTDGFAIRSLGRDVYVYGASEKGAMNGIYALVENNTDFIAVRPNPKIGCVFTKRPDLSLVWGEKVLDVPKGNVRGFWNTLGFEYWNANRCSNSPRPWTDALPYTRGGHNISNFLPRFEEHPEYYGLYDGRRDKAYGNMQCFAKPDFDSVTLSLVKNFARAVQMTELAGLSVSLDDSRRWCQCDLCQVPIRLPDGSVVDPRDRDFMSTRYFLWLNKAARELAAMHPGKGVKTIAYFQSVEPPRCDIEPNIGVGFCPYPVADDLAPVFMPQNMRWLRRLAGWSKKVPRSRLYIRGYDGLGMAFPRPLAHTRARNLREFYRYADGIDSESVASSRDGPDPRTHERSSTMDTMDISAIEYWVTMRLYWNPDEDVEQLYKKFCWRAFREAAVPMERFYGAFREEIIRAGVHPKWNFDVGTLKCLDDLRARLDEAEAAVKHPVSAQLVACAKRRFQELVESSKAKKAKK